VNDARLLYSYLLPLVLLATPLAACIVILLVPRLRRGRKWKIVQAFEKRHREFSTLGGHAFAYLTTLAGFLFFVPISILTLFLIGRAIGIVDNSSVHPILFGSNGGVLRSWLELCYFAASIIVAGVAWFAVRFAADQARQARKQSEEAERSRAAQVYLQITGRFISSDISKSRVLSAHVIRGFDPANGVHETMGEFFHAKVNPLRTSADRKEVNAYMRHMAILAFFEDVGVLVRQHYVRLDDIRLLFKGAVLTTRAIFEHHIMARREAEKAPEMFQNFIDLCQAMEEPPNRDEAPATSNPR
jgi:hypothetical protein